VELEKSKGLVQKTKDYKNQLKTVIAGGPAKSREEKVSSKVEAWPLKVFEGKEAIHQTSE